MSAAVVSGREEKTGEVVDKRAPRSLSDPQASYFRRCTSAKEYAEELGALSAAGWRVDRV